MKKRLLIILAALVVLSSAVRISAYAENFDYKQKLPQIASQLPDDPENGCFTAIALHRYDNTLDLTGFGSLIAGKDVPINTVTAMKYALTVKACGIEGSVYDALDKEKIKTAESTSGLVFSLHLANNGYDTGLTVSMHIDRLLARVTESGGFPTIGTTPDIDMTSMAIQALAPHKDEKDVAEAIEKALSYLSSQQKDTGAFRYFGSENCENCAQAVMALSSLGIDARSDDRFIKNGVSVYDALLSYRLPDGSFEHTHGTGANGTATAQAYCALINNDLLTPFYVIDSQEKAPETTEAPETTTEPQTETEPETTQVQKTTEPETTAEPVTTEVSEATSEPETAVGSETISEPETTSGPEITSEPETTKEPETDTEPETTGQTTTETETMETEETTAAEDTKARDEKGKPSVTVIIIIAVCAAGVTVCVVMLILKRKRVIDYIIIIVITAGVAVYLGISGVKLGNEYFGGEETVDVSGYITFSVDCSLVLDKEMIPPQKVEIEENDTAYSVLIRICRQKGLTVVNNGSKINPYISGIGDLYEASYGPTSGWGYKVNGKAPSVGSGAYVLNDGDVLEWLYVPDVSYLGDYE
ncbi:MAG: DUF4430 domain-containing protein [Clostridia bacterium]|nr:DUF4430 domain-containing protein [Clostridia bacterium]